MEWTTLVSNGVTTFGTITTAVFGNPVMAGVIMFGIVVGMIGLVWATFKH